MVDVHWRDKDYEKKIKQSLSKIKKDDMLIHLWDICMWKDTEVHEKYIEPLLCRKLLVRWNHDNKSNTWYLNHWWDWVVDEYIININNKWVILSHMPIIDIRDWVYNIHWHYHDRLIKPISDYHKLYSPEKEDYELKELCNFI